MASHLKQIKRCSAPTQAFTLAHKAVLTHGFTINFAAFPHELHNHIVSFIASDYQSLLALATTCKEGLAIARRVLSPVINTFSLNDSVALACKLKLHQFSLSDVCKYKYIVNKDTYMIPITTGKHKGKIAFKPGKLSVAYSWKAGIANARNSIRTDGQTVYSFHTPIAWTITSPVPEHGLKAIAPGFPFNGIDRHGRPINSKDTHVSYSSFMGRHFNEIVDAADLIYIGKYASPRQHFHNRYIKAHTELEQDSANAHKDKATIKAEAMAISQRSLSRHLLKIPKHKHGNRFDWITPVKFPFEAKFVNPETGRKLKHGRIRLPFTAPYLGTTRGFKNPKRHAANCVDCLERSTQRKDAALKRKIDTQARKAAQDKRRRM